MTNYDFYPSAIKVKHIAIIGIITFSLSVPAYAAGGWSNENTPWQFESNADKANKMLVLDVMEKKKGGYYDGFKTVTNITNNIDKQINCQFQPTAKANESQIAQTAQTSSPQAPVSANSNSDSAGNSYSKAGDEQNSSTDTNRQNNTGSVSASVDHSPSSANGGVINAGNGQTSQSGHSTQSNSGHQSVTTNGGQACEFRGALN
ncbi:hypothetical protein KRX19_02375 [Cardiobacteriaceae bacterium TAE3-ERU3]|nr:hypothetical protein [Cardiobacteriaceae bacterium TAE3-ERU3]